MFGIRLLIRIVWQKCLHTDFTNPNKQPSLLIPLQSPSNCDYCHFVQLLNWIVFFFKNRPCTLSRGYLCGDNMVDELISSGIFYLLCLFRQDPQPDLCFLEMKLISFCRFILTVVVSFNYKFLYPNNKSTYICVI